ncbi:MAG: hypothetical protein ACOYK8_00460 [Alphaproteobacteria bacterium]
MRKRFIWCKKRQTWVERAQYMAEKAAEYAPNPDFSTPFVITDSMNATVCPVDGKAYESKRDYYQTVRAAGCQIIGGSDSNSGLQGSAAQSVNWEQAIIDVMNQKGI